MARISNVLQRIFSFGAGLSMALVFAIIFLNSLRRYTLGRSVEWGEELPIYLTIYGVMFGVALAYSQDRHIRFTILTEFLSEQRRKKLFALVDLTMVVTGVTLAYSGYAFMQRRGGVDSSGLIGTARSLAETAGIEALAGIGKLATYQFALSVGGVLLALAALVKFFERLSEMKEI